MKRHYRRAIDHLLEVESLTTGDESVAIRMLLGKRYRRLGNCEKAAECYGLVADETNQAYLSMKAARGSASANERPPGTE